MKKAIIIDDEPLARQVILEYLEQHPTIEVVEECSDGFQGAKAINEKKPDLVFLDIQMPKINGFEMLEIVSHEPKIIFTTAFDEFALKAFEANAIDYLLKPFSQKRFDQAIEKWLNSGAITTSLEQLIESKFKQPDEQSRIVIRNGNDILIIPTNEVEYIEAYDDYVKIHHNNKYYLKKKTMNYFEGTLSPSLFVRVHRSFLLNIHELSKIESFEKNSYTAILRSGKRIPISRTAYGPLKESLGI